MPLDRRAYFLGSFIVEMEPDRPSSTDENFEATHARGICHKRRVRRTPFLSKPLAPASCCKNLGSAHRACHVVAKCPRPSSNRYKVRGVNALLPQLWCGDGWRPQYPSLLHAVQIDEGGLIQLETMPTRSARTASRRIWPPLDRTLTSGECGTTEQPISRSLSPPLPRRE